MLNPWPGVGVLIQPLVAGGACSAVDGTQVAPMAWPVGPGPLSRGRHGTGGCSGACWDWPGWSSPVSHDLLPRRWGGREAQPVFRQSSAPAGTWAPSWHRGALGEGPPSRPQPCPRPPGHGGAETKDKLGCWASRPRGCWRPLPNLRGLMFQLHVHWTHCREPWAGLRSCTPLCPGPRAP